MAQAAEQAGWDGFFVWEPVWGIDAWVSLTAAAMVTERIKLGTMLTPISRMRPWKLASETATLDNLSGGRVILAVGLGALDTGFAEFGEETDRRVRAELMDEGLDVLTGLWRGQPFSYSGKHYQIQPSDFMTPPPPIQQPRIPIWVVGGWPYPKSMRRVLRYDGVIPSVYGPDGNWKLAEPNDIRAIKAYVESNRQIDGPFDIIVEGVTPGDNPAQAREIVESWAEAGATWWIESPWELESLDDLLTRIQHGPPRLV